MNTPEQPVFTEEVKDRLNARSEKIRKEFLGSGESKTGTWGPEATDTLAESHRILVEPRMVRLLQCTRRACQKVFPDDEMVWVRAGLRHDGTCPGCGCKVHYPLHSDGRNYKIGGEDRIPFDLATLPGIPVHPKAGKRVKAELARLKDRILGKPAGPEWLESCPGVFVTQTPFFPIAVRQFDEGWEVWEPETLFDLFHEQVFPTREAAQQAAVARAIELVEGTLAILKP